VSIVSEVYEFLFQNQWKYIKYICKTWKLIFELEEIFLVTLVCTRDSKWFSTHEIEVSNNTQIGVRGGELR